MEQHETLDFLKEKAKHLRQHIVEMIGTETTGHLGGSCSLAEIISTLYFHVINYKPDQPSWKSRDRLILSKGHAVLVQYAAFVEMGLIPKKELQNVKRINSVFQGHPDMKCTPGIEAVTGSLGQGLSIGFGMALGLRLDNNQAKVFVILGDGELSEGQVWEAVLSIPTFGINNLTAIIDRNKIQATGPTDKILPISNIEEKWDSFGWHTITVDGHNIEKLISAFSEASTVTEKPVVIIADTVKGKGVRFAENDAAYHNCSFNTEDYQRAVESVQKD